MKYSVLIPAYNCADSIAQAVESLQNAGLPDLEVLIVNDGSTDRTAAVLEALCRRWSNLRVLTKPNGGVSSARNAALRLARGDYLAFLDADDCIEENAYRHVAELLQTHQPDMLLFGMRMEAYHRGRCYQTESMCCPSAGLLRRAQWLPQLEALFRCNYLSSVCNKFIRRELVLQNALCFSEEMFLLEDCRFSLDCLQFCDTVYLLAEPLYRYQLFDDGRKSRERLKRVASLGAYMKQFDHLPEAFSPVVHALYGMLLQQRLAAADRPDELEREMRDCRQSPFYQYALQAGQIPEALQRGDGRAYLRRSRLLRLRHRAAVAWKTRKAARRSPAPGAGQRAEQSPAPGAGQRAEQSPAPSENPVAEHSWNGKQGT